MIIKNQFKENTIAYNDLLLSSSKIHNWQAMDSFPLDGKRSILVTPIGFGIQEGKIGNAVTTIDGLQFLELI